ncbi:MAG: hypothetical protein ABLQ96_11760 [Candidatus Acidiferrum sp.]
MKIFLKFAAVLCLLAAGAGGAYAQYEGELTAKRRVFTDAGNGVRVVKSAGERTSILSSQGLQVFDAREHKLLTIGAAGAGSFLPENFDVDGDGQIYVADRAANAIVVYSTDGTRVRSVSVHAPMSVAALPGGEVAVSNLQDPHLVVVYDKNGRDIREFGELEDISSHVDLNRFLNSGYLATDARGNIYYAFIYAPEPTVRQYDRNGFAMQTVQFTEIEAFATAQAARKEIERQERKGKAPQFKPILTAVGVARDTGEIWMALHNRLLRFDKEGNRQATYQLYTPEGARLDATTISVEKDRMLIGSDNLGIFEFERPELKLEQK